MTSYLGNQSIDKYNTVYITYITDTKVCELLRSRNGRTSLLLILWAAEYQQRPFDDNTIFEMNWAHEFYDELTKLKAIF